MGWKRHSNELVGTVVEGVRGGEVMVVLVSNLPLKQ